MLNLAARPKVKVCQLPEGHRPPLLLLGPSHQDLSLPGPLPPLPGPSPLAQLLCPLRHLPDLDQLVLLPGPLKLHPDLSQGLPAPLPGPLRLHPDPSLDLPDLLLDPLKLHPGLNPDLPDLLPGLLLLLASPK